MNRLEQQAIDKEREKEVLKRAVVSLHRKDELTPVILKSIVDKAFILGHNAGHCRGEQYIKGTKNYEKTLY